MKFEFFYSKDKTPIESSSVKGTTLKASIDSLYIMGKMILNDPHLLYAPIIKLGELITIVLREEEKNQIVKSYSMRILDYNKTSDEEDPFSIRNIEISLISAWYFDQAEKTTAFKGNVSSILANLIKKESFFQERRVFFDNGSDEATTRYQIKESLQEFITKTIPYGISNNSPLFAYMGLDENFYLKSWDSMVSDAASYVLVPRKSEDGLSVYAGAGTTLIPMYGYSFVGNGNDLSFSREYTFTTEHVPYNPPKKIIADMVAKDSSLVAAKKKEKISNTYQWYQNPRDAVNLAIRDVLMSNWELTQMTAITGPLVFYDISVGKSILVKHQQPSIEESGKYVIHSLTEIWGTDGPFTKLLLIKV